MAEDAEAATTAPKTDHAVRTVQPKNMVVPSERTKRLVLEAVEKDPDGALNARIAENNDVPIDFVYKVRRERQISLASAKVSRLADQYLSDMDGLRGLCSERMKSIGKRIGDMQTMLENKDDLELTAGEIVSIHRAIGDAERNLLAFGTALATNLSRSEFTEFIRRMSAAASVQAEAMAREGV